MLRFRKRRVVATVLLITVCTFIAFVNYANENFEEYNDIQDVYRSSIIDGKLRPWFLSSDKGVDINADPLRLWPDEDPGDRIVNQLMYVPKENITDKVKTILLYFGRGGWSDLPLGRRVFLRDKCPVNACSLTTHVGSAEKADAVFFKDSFTWPFHKRSPEQVWILFLLECPLHTQDFKNLRNVFNWTATYRHDSDIVAPYEKYVSFSSTPSVTKPNNYAANKTKKVAWFVSNCATKNHRKEYAMELAKHIKVDIYGSCGPYNCPRLDAKKCFEMLDRDYKFYLAFENSNCKDYITEKLFVNSLGHNVLPIVMGARKEDYERSAPPHSYIHVDDFESPRHLAEYLTKLDQNDTLYNEYFKWKGNGEFINTYFWCRVCAMLHAPSKPKSYPDIQEWWSGKGTCTTGSWNDPSDDR